MSAILEAAKSTEAYGFACLMVGVRAGLGMSVSFSTGVASEYGGCISGGLSPGVGVVRLTTPAVGK